MSPQRVHREDKCFTTFPNLANSSLDLNKETHINFTPEVSGAVQSDEISLS